MTNIEIVKGMYEAFGRGDMANVMDASADDVEWLVPGSPAVIPYSGQYRGRAAVGEFFKKLDEALHSDPFVITDYLSGGDKVAVPGSFTGHSKTRGRAFGSDWVMVFTLRNGKVIHFREYLDTAVAEAAFA